MIKLFIDFFFIYLIFEKKNAWVTCTSTYNLDLIYLKECISYFIIKFVIYHSVRSLRKLQPNTRNAICIVSFSEIHVYLMKIHCDSAVEVFNRIHSFIHICRNKLQEIYSTRESGKKNKTKSITLSIQTCSQSLKLYTII